MLRIWQRIKSQIENQQWLLLFLCFCFRVCVCLRLREINLPSTLYSLPSCLLVFVLPFGRRKKQTFLSCHQSSPYVDVRCAMTSFRKSSVYNPPTPSVFSYDTHKRIKKGKTNSKRESDASVSASSTGRKSRYRPL